MKRKSQNYTIAKRIMNPFFARVFLWHQLLPLLDTLIFNGTSFYHEMTTTNKKIMIILMSKIAFASAGSSNLWHHTVGEWVMLWDNLLPRSHYDKW